MAVSRPRPTLIAPHRQQLRTLQDLGLERVQRRAFSRAEVVTYNLRSESEPGIAVIRWMGSRVRSGIIEIHDVGGGNRSLHRFRDRSLAVARAFGAGELEIFGGAIINRRLQEILLGRGFIRALDVVPDALGGGAMEILTRIDTV